MTERETPNASASCSYCTFVGEGKTLGSARLERDRHMAHDCAETPTREQTKAASRIHWI